ncbi:MAG: DUF3103 family protein, partial [Pseudomonadota bacterium]
MRPSFSISMALATTVVGFHSYADSINTTTSSLTSTNVAEQKQSLALQISASYADLESSLKAQITEESLSMPIDKLNSAQPYSTFSSEMQKADLSY